MGDLKKIGLDLGKGIGMGIGMDLRLGLDLRSMFGFRVESRTRSGIEAWLCLQVSTIKFSYINKI